MYNHWQPIELPELDSLRVNRTNLLELLETRHALEVLNVSIAAEKRTDDDILILNKLIKEMETSLGNDIEGERIDLLFHVSLAKATYNSIMVQLFESILNPMEMAIRKTRRVEMYAKSLVAKRLYEEHLMILEAVTLCDKHLAAQRMRIHLEHVESILLNMNN